MKEKIIFATGNKGKMVEIREILQGLDREVLSMKEAGISLDIVEDGNTLEENAMIKARAVAAHCDALVLADDSGLEIDALGGAPGVHSARYMGEETPYSIKNQAILDQLQGLSQDQRKARFRCVIAAVFPGGEEMVTQGVVEGVIAEQPQGEGGFGYDPIFFLPEKNKTTAELTSEEKNAISHRGQALMSMRKKIEEWIKSEEVRS